MLRHAEGAKGNGHGFCWGGKILWACNRARRHSDFRHSTNPMANTRSTECDRGQLTIGNGIPCTSHTIFQSNVHAYFINIGQPRQKRDTTTHLVGASLVQKAGEPRIKNWGSPLLVQYWMPRLKAVDACDVGPPWILISSGGFSPGGSLKSCEVWSGVSRLMYRALSGHHKRQG